MLITGELSISRAKKALEGRQADILYSDPPWGPGNLKYWRTQNKEICNQSWESFLNLFCFVVEQSVAPCAHIFVEMGVRWVDELKQVMLHHGFKETARWRCLYGSPKRPNYLWYSGPGVDIDPGGMSGVSMTQYVLQSVARPGLLVFDPCAGKGMTAKCALRSGMEFAGVELNPSRAKITQDIMGKYDSNRLQHSRKK